MTAQAAGTATAAADPKPLLSLVQPAEGAAGQAWRLMCSLLGSWHVVASRADALELAGGPSAGGGGGGGGAARGQQQGRRLNVVTLAGEIFKADGEIVASGAGGVAGGGAGDGDSPQVAYG